MTWTLILLVLMQETYATSQNAVKYLIIWKKISLRGIIFLLETHTVLKDEKVWTNQFGCGKDTVFSPMVSHMQKEYS